MCTIDGADLDIELIVYPRTVTTPLATPKGSEFVSGVGAGADFTTAPDGNFQILAIKTLASSTRCTSGYKASNLPRRFATDCHFAGSVALGKLE